MIVHVPDDTPSGALTRALTEVNLVVDKLDVSDPENPVVHTRVAERATVVAHPTVRRIADFRAGRGR